MSLPLSGLLVVSLEQAVAAPMCTCRLADAGARVIKVERPEGDFARYYDKLAKSRDGHGAGESAYFVWLNRGKDSISRAPTTRRCYRRSSPRPTCSCRTSNPAPSPSSALRSRSCGARIRGS
jgi:hypothetical protein